jgi:hypothetical protein
VSFEVRGTCFAKAPFGGCNDAAENAMKIYLLMLLIGALFMAIRLTSPQEQRSESLPQ